MKITNFLALAIFSVLAFSSFTKKDFDPLAITVKIADNTYMDRAEITNINWREFMSWTAKEYGKTSDQYLSIVPSQDVWTGEKFEKLKDNYLNDAVYNNYPVVGISHQQAVTYCTWRADRINEVLRMQNKKSTIQYSCRLPTKAEWETLAKSEMFTTQNFKSEYHSLQAVNDDGTIQELEITSPVKSFTPSLNGYFNLIGNVAEMVSEKGIAKGGSWQHMNIDVSIGKDFTYSAPTNWLGFRCVLETK